jgi:ribosome-binding factor A
LTKRRAHERQGGAASGPPGERASRRAAQVGGEIAELLSALLLRGEVHDPRVGMIAITKVRVTPDLRLARVVFVTLGDADARAAALAGLKSAAPFLRHRLAEELALRHMPELVFTYDDELQDARRVDSLLRGLVPSPSKTSE